MIAPLSSRCNDQAMAHIVRVRAGALDMYWLTSGQGQGSRDQASEEGSSVGGGGDHSYFEWKQQPG